MARTSGSKLPQISCPSVGYRCLACVILLEPLAVAMGEKTGDREQAIRFLETEFASVLLGGLNVSQDWLLEKLAQ